MRTLAWILIFVLGFGATALEAEAQSTFFLADAESGTLKPPWDRFYNDHQRPDKIINTTERAKNGNRSFRFWTPDACSTCGSGGNQAIAVHRPKRVEKYVSFWIYVQQGMDAASGRGTIMQFKADYTSAGYGEGPKFTIAGNNKAGPRRLGVSMSQCGLSSGSTTPKATIVGEVDSSCKWKTSVNFPFQTWVHLEVYYRASTTNGEFSIWQDGVEIFYVTHANMNTLTNPSPGGSANQHEREFLEWLVGPYADEPMLFYVDDARVTDHQVFRKQSGSPPVSPSTLRIRTGR